MYNKIKSIVGRWVEQEFKYSNKYVLVFSHPRSGTHFMEAFLAKNFYQQEDLMTDNVVWGHWSNRLVNGKGNEFGKLFGSHIFPNRGIGKVKMPIIYIYRDGRAVAYSIWKTNNFIHSKYKGISFSDFLRLKLDWRGTPAIKVDNPSQNIVEHWFEHVNTWFDYAKRNNKVVIVRYEDLVRNPYQVYLMIHNKVFSDELLLSNDNVNPISNAVGLLPNKAVIDSWREAFSESDLDFFMSNVKHDEFFDKDEEK
ncbi:sulfotransferase domain-containing protein [Limibacter armeniacum]|uniref:sulfotransferase domain-containing protein n=1 Tax=Limibacter armeniacum TaxID=466084 RepID=UPI002FE6A29B